MSKPKNQNSILVLATLGVYLGLVLLGATPQVLAQDGPSEQINRRPLIDFARYVNDRLQSKDFDPTAAFSITVEGPLSGKGFLDVSASTVHSSGDPKLAEIAKTGLMAINNAGYFQYLSALGSQSLAITVSQDDKSFSGYVVAEVKTAERAKTVVSGLKMILLMKTEDNKHLEDKLFLQNTTVTADGAKITIKLVLPAESFRQIWLSKVVKTNCE